MTERVPCKTVGCARDILLLALSAFTSTDLAPAQRWLTMLFVAQLACDEIDLGEGIFYASVCPACRISAVTFQQS